MVFNFEHKLKPFGLSPVPSPDKAPIDFIPTKYLNSPKYSISSLLLKAPPSSVTAAASAYDNSPSPLVSQLATHTALTLASAKTIATLS